MHFSLNHQQFFCDTQQEANLLGGVESWSICNIGDLASTVTGLAYATIDPVGLPPHEAVAYQAKIDTVRDEMINVIATVAGPLVVAQCEQFLGKQLD